MCLIHKWTKWNTIKEGEKKTYYDDGSSIITGYAKFQEKQCLKCKKIQLRVTEAEV